MTHIDRRTLVLVGAVVGPPAISLCIVPGRSSIGGPPVALVLVLAITACAAYGSVGAGIVASATSSLSFDYWFTAPFDDFQITRRGDIETTVLLFVIGAATSALAVHARRGNALAERRSSYLEMLHDFAEMVATGERPEFVVIRAAAELTDLLFLEDCRFEPTAPDSKLPRLEAGGDVFVANIRWDVGELGFPGRVVELLVESHGQSRGRFVLTPTTGRPVSLDRRIVAIALVDQVGSALTGQLREE